jgi:hypothetical protein
MIDAGVPCWASLVANLDAVSLAVEAPSLPLSRRRQPAATRDVVKLACIWNPGTAKTRKAGSPARVEHQTRISTRCLSRVEAPSLPLLTAPT